MVPGSTTQESQWKFSETKRHDIELIYDNLLLMKLYIGRFKLAPLVNTLPETRLTLIRGGWLNDWVVFSQTWIRLPPR